MDAYLAHQESKLTPDEAHELKQYKDGFLEIPPLAVRHTHLWSTQLAAHLRKHKLFWVSDLVIANQNLRQKSNMKLRGLYSSTRGGKAKHQWVRTYLFDVKGLFTAEGRCEFSLTSPSAVVDTHESHATWLEKFIESAAYDIVKLQGDSPQNIWDFHQTHTDRTCKTFTDGSMKGVIGTYACNIMELDINASSLSGGGKEDYSQIIEQCLSQITSFRISSTRMEALALLALHIALQYLDPKHELTYRNGCDSTAAIFTYQKLLSLNRMQLPQLPNSDVWRLIKLYRLSWGNIPQFHVPSHMDKYVSSPEFLLPEWIGNIMVDKAADERYHEDEETINTTELTKNMIGITYHGNNVICVPFKTWARKHVALLHIKHHFKSHHPSIKENITVNWSSMESISRTRRYIWQRKAAMKTIWSLYAFQHTKMTRKHCLPSHIN